MARNKSSKENSTYTVDNSLSFLDPMPHSSPATLELAPLYFPQTWLPPPLLYCWGCLQLPFHSALEWPIIWVCLDLRYFLTWILVLKPIALGTPRMTGHLTTYSLWPTSFTLLASFIPNNNIICSNHPSQKSGSHYRSLLPVWWCAKSCQFYLPSNSWLPALQISWLDYFNSKGQCLPHTPFPLTIHKAAKVKF